MMETVRHKSMALALAATALTLGTWLYQPRAILAASASPSAESAVPTDWSVYTGGVNGDHYSPLTQITPANVAGLKQVWRVDVGSDGGLQANPLVVGRVVYGYGSTLQVFALDGVTGK